MIFLTLVNLGYSQDKYPQVTKIKQKCYEIYDKMGESPSEVKDMVYKKINHICDSIVNASSLDYPYIDLQVMSKKGIVETAKRYADAEIKAAQDLKEKKRLEMEARQAKLKAEQEEREKNAAEEAKKLAVKKKEIFDEFVNKVDIAKQLTEQQQQKVYQRICHLSDSLIVVTKNMDKDDFYSTYSVYSECKPGTVAVLDLRSIRYAIDHKVTAYAKYVYETDLKNQVEAAKKEFTEKKGVAIKANLQTYLSNAIEYAKLNDLHFNAKAYKQFEKILDMFLNDQLEHISVQVTPNMKFYGWVDQNGKPYGPAIIIKKYSEDHYLGYQYGSINSERYYDGVFFDGKPIYGAMARHSGYATTIYTRGFTDFYGKATQGTRSFMHYNENNRLMASVDVNGKCDGLSVGSYVTLMKAGKDIQTLFTDEDTMLPLYNYMTKGQTNPDVKMVNNFEIEPDVKYTGEWKDGAPAGSGVTYYGYSKGDLLMFEKKNTLGEREKVCFITDGKYQEANETDKGSNSIYVTSHERGAICFPAGNNNVGYELIHTNEQLTMQTLMMQTMAPMKKAEDYDNLNKQFIGKKFNITNRVMRYEFYPYDGEGAPSYTYVGFTTGGSYTIKTVDEQERMHFKRRVNGTYTFEGIQLDDKNFIGVYYDYGQFVYIGHMVEGDQESFIKQGAGYLIDANDGEIMRQGIWENNSLVTTQDVKSSINAEINVDITAICAKDKAIKKGPTRKLATGVTSVFDFSVAEKEFK